LDYYSYFSFDWVGDSEVTVKLMGGQTMFSEQGKFSKVITGFVRQIYYVFIAGLQAIGLLVTKYQKDFGIKSFIKAAVLNSFFGWYHWIRQ